MTGHEHLRNGALACVFRIRDRRKPRPGQRVEWQGALSSAGIRMPSGDAPLRSHRAWRVGVVKALAKAVADIPNATNSGATNGGVPSSSLACGTVSGVGMPVTGTLSALEIDPELERMWRGGRLRPEERDLCFAQPRAAFASRTMVSAIVPAVGAFFLVRALSDGHVEAIPFGPADDMFQEDRSIARHSVLICFLTQLMGPGYLDPRSDTLLADLATLNPYETARAAGAAAPEVLADLLFGPVNAQIGDVLERATGPRSLQLDPGGAMSAALGVAAEITGKTIVIHWQPPASCHGYPRIEGAAALEGFLTSDEECIVQALFMAASDRMTPEIVLPSDVMEPAHPWAPRVRPSYRFSAKGRSCHTVLADVSAMSDTWSARRREPAEAWRFHRFDGRPIPTALLDRLDRYFGVA